MTNNFSISNMNGVSDDSTKKYSINNMCGYSDLA